MGSKDNTDNNFPKVAEFNPGYPYIYLPAEDFD